MTPFYQDDWATIYHGDSLSVLRLLPMGTVKLAILDPPVEKGQSFPWLPMICDLLRPDGTLIHFGAAWDVHNLLNRVSSLFNISEVIALERSGPNWSPIVIADLNPNPSRRFRFNLFYRMPRTIGVAHHAQRSDKLMEMLISKTSREGDIVLDPYMGSGATLVAAKRRKRKSIGIEIVQRYCLRAQRLVESV